MGSNNVDQKVAFIHVVKGYVYKNSDVQFVEKFE